MFLRKSDTFSLQRLLGHSSLEMTRRYCALADADLRDKHRVASPGDRFFEHTKPTNGMKRLRYGLWGSTYRGIAENAWQRLCA